METTETTQQEEIWKDIPEYEGYYQVSNLGRVKSLKRKINNGRYKKEFFIYEKILVSIDIGNGYLRVSLNKSGKKKPIFCHRLVAVVFILNPENKPCVNHIDGDVKNNHSSNLEWCTHSENMKHAIRVLKNDVPTTSRRRVFNIPRKVVCIETEEIFKSVNAASKRIKRSTNYVSQCCKNQKWTAGGFRWMYYEEYLKFR